MLFDGTYTYAYDPNGNRTMKWVNNNGVAESSPQAGDTDITVYGWNEKNQLVKVNYYATYYDYINGINNGTGDYEVDYRYDAFGDMVSRSPTNLAGEAPSTTSTTARICSWFSLAPAK